MNLVEVAQLLKSVQSINSAKEVIFRPKIRRHFHNSLIYKDQQFYLSCQSGDRRIEALTGISEQGLFIWRNIDIACQRN